VTAIQAPIRLFVYGTLRRGEVAHGELRGARLLAATKTIAAYELVDLGEYPALVERGTDHVVGEVYEVDPDLLRTLDAYEDVPELYERKPVRLIDGEAEGYVLPSSRALNAPRIPSGDWRSP
jgi:gamma-glutamylaminecyclotransferase